MSGPGDAERYAVALWPQGEPHGLVLPVWWGDDKSTKFAPVEDPRRAARIALARPTDVYLGMGALLSRPLSGRGAEKDVGAIACVWAECDTQDGHASGADVSRYPPDLPTLLGVLGELALRPTMVVASGNGAHAYCCFREPWVLDTPAERREAKTLVAGFQAFVRAAFKRHEWTIDSTADLSRVLRFPGTFNGKNGHRKPTDLLWLEDDLRYNPSDLWAYVPEEIPVSGAVDVEAVMAGATTERWGSDEALLTMALGSKGGEAFADLYHRGDLSRYGGDHSKADMALARRLLFWAGGNPQWAYELHRGSALMREKWDSRRGSTTYGWYTIGKLLAEGGEYYQPSRAVVLTSEPVVEDRPTAPVTDEANPTTEAPSSPPSEPSPFSGWLEPGRERFLRPDEVDAAGIIRGVLAAGGIAIVAGEPKVGKTWLAIALALSVANGVPFLGTYPVSQSGRVLYIATEGSWPRFKGRVAGLALGMGLTPLEAVEGIDFVWRKPVRLDDRACIDWLTSIASGYGLVIVDVLRDTWTGDENSANDVGGLARHLRRIATAGPTVALVSHFNKPTKDNQRFRDINRIRGSSVFGAVLDSGFYLSQGRDESRTTVSLVNKDDVSEEPFSFAWPREFVDGSTGVTLDRQGETYTERAAAITQEQILAVTRAIDADPGISRKELADRLPGVPRDTTRIILARLLHARTHEERPSPYVNSAGRPNVRPGFFRVDAEVVVARTTLSADTSREGSPRGVTEQFAGHAPRGVTDNTEETLATQEDLPGVTSRPRGVANRRGPSRTLRGSRAPLKGAARCRAVSGREVSDGHVQGGA